MPSSALPALLCGHVGRAGIPYNDPLGTRHIGAGCYTCGNPGPLFVSHPCCREARLVQGSTISRQRLSGQWGMPVGHVGADPRKVVSIAVSLHLPPLLLQGCCHARRLSYVLPSAALEMATGKRQAAAFCPLKGRTGSGKVSSKIWQGTCLPGRGTRSCHCQPVCTSHHQEVKPKFLLSQRKAIKMHLDSRHAPQHPLAG